MTALADLLAMANDQDRSDGLGAYCFYRKQMTAFAAHYGHRVSTVTSAFVALSPNSDYIGNLRSLTSVLEGIKNGMQVEAITVSTYKACRNRAHQYLTGQTDFLKTVRGPKILAFRDNILRPKTSRLVTVDGHMVAAYVGDPNMTMKDAAYWMKRRAQYVEISDAISALADQHGMAPCQMQAILWHTRKRIFQIKFDAQTNLLDPFCVSTFPPYAPAKNRKRTTTIVTPPDSEPQEPRLI